MIVEIMLRQTSGYALRIGWLPSVRLGDRVRIDGRDEWVIARCLPRISVAVAASSVGGRRCISASQPRRWRRMR
jgi:hypothetical protein